MIFFIIALVHNLLVYQPTSGKWSKNLSDYTNFKASDQNQFIFKPQNQPKVGNVYQQTGQLKNIATQKEIRF